MKFKVQLTVIFSIFILINLSCVEHTVFIEIRPDDKVDYYYDAHGDREDLLDEDAPLPKQKDWFIITTLDDKSAETFDYSAQKRFLKNHKIPVTFFDGDSLFKESLLHHPTTINIRSWFVSKRYDFECRFEGRGVEQKYPKITGKLNDFDSQTGWQKEILQYIASETLELSDVGFNLYPVISSSIQQWFETTIFNVSDSLFLTNYYDYRKSILNIIKSPLDNNKKTVVDSVFKTLEDEARITIDLSDDLFLYKVLLPGLVTETNADSTSGDTLIWEFSVVNFQNNDFVMSASSVINYPNRKWFVIIFIAFLGLLLFLWYRIRN